jgi:hypothetical protein
MACFNCLRCFIDAEWCFLFGCSGARAINTSFHFPPDVPINSSVVFPSFLLSELLVFALKEFFILFFFLLSSKRRQTPFPKKLYFVDNFFYERRGMDNKCLTLNGFLNIDHGAENDEGNNL